MRRRGPLLFLGCVFMVLAQAAAATGVFMGIYGASCKDNAMCTGAGMFCDGSLERCAYCGDSCDHDLAGYCGDAVVQRVGSINVTDVLSACSSVVVRERNDGPGDGDGDGPGNGGGGPGLGEMMRQYKRARTASSWCRVCVSATSATPVITLTQAGTGATNVDNMALFDWITLLFASCVIALAIVGELKDIELCSMAIGHAWDNLHAVWRTGLIVLQGMRRWTFLPLLLLTVPSLVINYGGSALTVCLNTLAVVFLCGAWANRHSHGHPNPTADPSKMQLSFLKSPLTPVPNVVRDAMSLLPCRD